MFFVNSHGLKGLGAGLGVSRVSLPLWQGSGRVVGIELNRPGVYLMPESLETDCGEEAWLWTEWLPEAEADLWTEVCKICLPFALYLWAESPSLKGQLGGASLCLPKWHIQC